MSYRVLIVDDDPSTRYVYHQVLAVLGMELSEAASGAEALNLLSTDAPDLVVLDMLLPGVPGIDVLAYVYQQPHLAETHVLIVTAHQHYGDLALRGTDRLLFKPVSPRVMRQAALDVLQLPPGPDAAS